MKILVMGLPGAGKTTLSKALAKRLRAVHFNNDEVRRGISADLGFTHQDRVIQAGRMGWMCDQVVKAGGHAIADFVCPTKETRAAFAIGGSHLTVWVNRIKEGRFADTNAMFEPPEEPDVIVEGDSAPEHWAEVIAMQVERTFDWDRPTAFVLGRFQPWHDGHHILAVKAMEKHGQLCVGVRSTHGLSGNPFPFEYVRARIEDSLREYRGLFTVVRMPNVAGVYYGRDVGYAVEMIDLDEATKAISATEMRRRLEV